jgi:hypothetical protein
MSSCKKNTSAATTGTSAQSTEDADQAKEVQKAKEAKAAHRALMESIRQQQDLEDRIEPIPDTSAPSRSSQPATTQPSSFAQTIDDATRQVTDKSKKSSVFSFFKKSSKKSKDTSSSG